MKQAVTGELFCYILVFCFQGVLFDLYTNDPNRNCPKRTGTLEPERPAGQWQLETLQPTRPTQQINTLSDPDLGASTSPINKLCMSQDKKLKSVLLRRPPGRVTGSPPLLRGPLPACGVWRREDGKEGRCMRQKENLPLCPSPPFQPFRPSSPLPLALTPLSESVCASDGLSCSGVAVCKVCLLEFTGVVILPALAGYFRHTHT